MIRYQVNWMNASAHSKMRKINFQAHFWGRKRVDCRLYWSVNAIQWHRVVLIKFDFDESIEFGWFKTLFIINSSTFSVFIGKLYYWKCESFLWANDCVICEAYRRIIFLLVSLHWIESSRIWASFSIKSHCNLNVLGICIFS